MAEVVYLSVNTLKAHQQNNEYFDDIDGDNYQNFVKSIENDGVITPIIVASDMTIISGHQRVRACKDLGIETISAIIRDDLVSEDDRLQKLLATNFGRMRNDPAKFRKVVVKYTELCGFTRGGDRKSNGNNCRLNQAEIAKHLGISERTLRDLLELDRKLTPEAKALIDSNIINPTTAKKVWCKIDKQTQTDIIKEFGTDIIKKLTMRETQSLVDDYNSYKQDYQDCIDRLKELEESGKTMESMKSEFKVLQTKKDKLHDEYNALMIRISKLKEKEDEKNKHIASQAFIINKIRSGVDPLKKVKGELEQLFKEDYNLSEVGLREINREIDFLYDMAEMMNKFTKKVKVEVFVHE